MKNLALKKIQKMKLYKPPLNGRTDYRGLLLDFNERTKPISGKVIQALKKFVKNQKLQLYPEYFNLEKEIAKYAGVSPNQLILTNGSDQAIDIIFRTFTEKSDKVIIPSPTFAMFYHYAQIIGSTIISPVYKNLQKNKPFFPFKEVLNSIDEKVKLIVLCNPNNPTGNAISLADIKKIAKKAKNTIVFVDEAYFEFSKITAVPLLRKCPNIIISRTFSKAFGLAAFRIGYALARKEYIAEMLKVRSPYSINISASIAALAALQNRKSMETYVKEVMEKAKPLVEKFFLENGTPYFPSKANFILFQSKNPQSTFKKLAKAGVLLRLLNQKNIKNTLRLTIGTLKEMKKFIEIYKKVILNS